jgi:hypothetical protein
VKGLFRRAWRSFAGAPFTPLVAFAVTAFAPLAQAQTYDLFSGSDAPLPSSEPPVTPVASARTEPPAPRFGAQGEFVVTGDSSIGISSEQFSGSPATRFNATFSPGLDYFVVPNLSIGATANVAYQDDTGYDSSGNLYATKTTSVSVAPRLGFNVPFGDYVSWYPRVAFGFLTQQNNTSLVTLTSNPSGAPFQATTSRASGAWMSLFAPILFHPAPHFFIGIGPRLTRDFTHLEGASASFGQPITIDGEFVIGGWWGGSPDNAHSSNAPSSGTPARRFGEASEWVFTGETSVSVSSTHYSVQGSSSSVQFEPGFDYFFADNFAVGGDVYGTSSKSQGDDSFGVPYSNSSTSYGLAAHFSVNLPLGELFSLYPRGYLGFGAGSYNDTSGSNSNQATFTNSWVALYVPLLVHPAPHLFVGFGPSVKHDLSFDYSSPNGQQSSIQGTTLSADLIVGGWL